MLKFDEKTHTYKLGKDRVPSVTTVLGILSKPGLDWWGYNQGINGVIEVLRNYDIDTEHEDVLKNIKQAIRTLQLTPNHVLNNAAKRGTTVHKAFETFADSGNWPEVEKDYQGYVKSIQAFIEKYEPEIIAVEQKVYSPSLKVAGTFDALMNIDNTLCLVDFKTSKAIYPTHQIQVSAYEGMRQELKMGNEAQPLIVRAKESGREAEVKESISSYEDFKTVYNVYKMMEQFG